MVVAIIGIISAVAYPSYQSSVLKGHRAEAQADLLEIAGSLERTYTETGSYTTAALPFSVSPRTGSTSYNITLAKAAATFTITATPAGAQTSDSCGTLTLAHTGVQTPATEGCW